jgi:hypothetical protein
MSAIALAVAIHTSIGMAVDARQVAQPAPVPPPAQAPPAPAPAPAPAAQPDKSVDPGVRDALLQYAAALESLDADAVKKVQPSIDVEGLKRAFREMRALEVDIDNIRLLSSESGSARVSCRVAQTLTPKAGSRQTTSVTRVLRLRRQDSGWIIQGFER